MSKLIEYRKAPLFIIIDGVLTKLQILPDFKIYHAVLSKEGVIKAKETAVTEQYVSIMLH